MRKDVFKIIEEHVREYNPKYDWNGDPLYLTLLQSKIAEIVPEKINPPKTTDPNKWTEQNWIDFYNAVKVFLEE